MTEEFLPPERKVIARLSEEDRLRNIGKYGGFTPRQANQILKAKLGNSLTDVAIEMIPDFITWMRELGKVNPGQAAELFMGFVEFAQPRLKAAQVNVNADASMIPVMPGDATQDVRNMTLEQLEEMANAQSGEIVGNGS